MFLKINSENLSTNITSLYAFLIFRIPVARKIEILPFYLHVWMLINLKNSINSLHTFTSRNTINAVS